MKKEYLFLSTIVLCAAIFRLWNVNWDMNFHFHPDERAIVLYTLPLQFPHTLQEFFSINSLWNPHFFAYGSFPLYLLKVIASLVGYIDVSYTQYDGITIIGRIISALFDSGTVILVFFLGKKLYNKWTGMLAAGFYSLSVLPIQLAHFYAVDTLLTFFITLLLYQLCVFYEKPSIKQAIRIGVCFGFALATKISALILFVSIISTIWVDFVILFAKAPHKPKHWFAHIPLFLKRFLIEGIFMLISASATFIFLEPYALIDFSSFYTQSMQQAEMTKNAFTFPYTLQYVGKIPYVYELTNIFFWGLGPLLTIFVFIGIAYSLYSLIKTADTKQNSEYIIWSFLLVYFLVVGKFAIGFMRYMLPIYPLLVLFAAKIVYIFFLRLHIKAAWHQVPFFILLFIFLAIWPVSFLHIYQYPSTRIKATDWILSHIPAGKIIAIEHWDDALPIRNQQLYGVETLELYNPDTPEKWEKIHNQLQKSDYIIIASNRLYVPLQKLTDCTKLPQLYCYQQTATYYKNLFSGKSNFKRIAEFAIYPQIPFFHIPINDQSADESFTVYDHPKIIIFVKK